MALAQNADDLRNVQQEMESNQKKADHLAKQAATLDREVADLQTALISAAADVQNREREVTEIENTLTALGQSEHEKGDALLQGREELSATLMALQRLSSMPRQALFFGPEKPIDLARSTRLLSLTTPVLDARAATRIYKSLGLIEPPNDDTWRLPASRLRFVDGEYPRQLVEEFEQDPPAVVVLGSTVPQREFTALRTFLKAHYVRDPAVRMGKLELWRRRDRARP